METGTGNRRSTNGKNRAFCRAREVMFHGGGGGNLTLIDLVARRAREKGSEVLSCTRWALMSDGRHHSRKSKPDDQKDGEQASSTLMRKEACHQTGAGLR